MRKPRLSPNIEMIPLIDVMFLLLIFFIYAALNLSVTKQTQVNLPKIMQAIQLEKDFNQIEINNQAEIFLNKKKLTITELEKNLSQDKPLYISIDQEVDYSKIAEVLSIVNQKGIKKISLTYK